MNAVATTMSFARYVIAILFLVASLTRIARAQELRGTVVDSASRRPVASAVLVALDQRGAPRARTITNDRGQYRLPFPTEARRPRALRLGFRARELALPAGIAELKIAMIVIPTLLEKMTVRSSSRTGSRVTVQRDPRCSGRMQRPAR